MGTSIVALPNFALFAYFYFFMRRITPILASRVQKFQVLEIPFEKRYPTQIRYSFGTAISDLKVSSLGKIKKGNKSCGKRT